MYLCVSAYVQMPLSFLVFSLAMPFFCQYIYALVCFECTAFFCSISKFNRTNSSNSDDGNNKCIVHTAQRCLCELGEQMRQQSLFQQYPVSLASALLKFLFYVMQLSHCFIFSFHLSRFRRFFIYVYYFL